MCDLYIPTSKKEISGFKIVLRRKKDGALFSPAVGFQYKPQKNGWIKMPPRRRKKLVKLTVSFSELLLEPNELQGYSSEMVGRTAIFLHYSSAARKARSINISNANYALYEIALFNATVRGRLLKGYYGDAEVAGGQEIKLGKEREVSGYAF